MLIAIIAGILLGIGIGWHLPPQMWNAPSSLPLGDTAFVLFLIAGLAGIWVNGFSRQRLVVGGLFGTGMLVLYEVTWRFSPTWLPVLYGIALAVLVCGGFAFALHDRFGRLTPAGHGTKSFLSYFGIITGIALTLWSALSLFLGKNAGRPNQEHLKREQDAATSRDSLQPPAPTSSLGSHPAKSSQPGMNAAHFQQIEGLVFELINLERARYGKKQLTSEKNLAQVAYLHSSDMLGRSFFSHINPDGQSPHDRIAAAYPNQVSATGENIWMSSGDQSTAEGLARKMVDGWMNSPGHRKNILSDDFSHTGIGVCQNAGETRATQVFAKPFGSVRK